MQETSSGLERDRDWDGLASRQGGQDLLLSSPHRRNRILPDLFNFLIPLSAVMQHMSLAQLLDDYAAGRRNFQTIDFRGVNLFECDLQNIDLQGCDLSDVNFAYANLSRANLHFAILQRADLSHTRLPMANLSHANLAQANFLRSDLAFSFLQGANCGQTILDYANLRQADLSYANLTSASLVRTNLEQAILKQTNLQQCNLFRAQYADLSEACMDDRTILPNGHWYEWVSGLGSGEAGEPGSRE